jgi:drug/metabolite transporter (DMT)-like permease
MSLSQKFKKQFNCSDEQLATLCIITSATLYGVLGYSGTKLINQHLSIPAMLFWRFITASIWMLLVGIGRVKKKRDFSRLKSSNSIFCLMLVVCCVGSSLFYFIASRFIGTGLAMVIFFAFPIFVVLLNWLVEKQPISKQTLFALIAILLGMCLVESNKILIMSLPTQGLLLALLAAFFYAVYIYKSKPLTQAFSPYFLTLMVCLGSSCTFLLMSLITKSFAFPASIQAWFYVFVIGILATALPIQLLLAGIKFVSAHKAAILSALEPLMTLAIGVVVLKESITLMQALGAAFILLSAIIIQFESSL